MEPKIYNLKWLNENDPKDLEFRTLWNGWNDLPKPIEGHTGKYVNLQLYLFNLLQDLKPKNILEIGFNAGHSACCFLNASPSSKMFTFDICRHGYEQKALNVLSKYYDITLTAGDSINTIPEFLKSNPDIRFDFILIDGKHSGDHPYKDIINTKDYLNNDGYIMIDDFDVPDVYKGYEKVNWDGFIDVNYPKIEKKIKIKYKP